MNISKAPDQYFRSSQSAVQSFLIHCPFTCRSGRPGVPVWTSAGPAARRRLCPSQEERQTSGSDPGGGVPVGVRDGKERAEPRGRPSLSHQELILTVWRLLFQAELEIQQDAVAPGQKVLVIDDLLATGGERCGGQHCPGPRLTSPLRLSIGPS